VEAGKDLGGGKRTREMCERGWQMKESGGGEMMRRRTTKVSTRKYSPGDFDAAIVRTQGRIKKKEELGKCTGGRRRKKFE